MDRLPVPAALERMRRLGFDGAEICLEDSSFSLRKELFDRANLEEAAAAAQSLELDCWSFSYHGDYIRDDAVFDCTLQAIRLTPALNTDIFVFSGGCSDKNADHEAERRILIERTAVLTKEAEACGVRLALETEPGFICGTTTDLLDLMDAVDSPALCCNADLGHIFLCDSNPIEAIATLGKRIIHCHVEDMRRGVHDHLVPGRGDIDLAAYLDALERIDFTGPAALDLYGYDYESVVPEAIGYLHMLGKSRDT